MFHVRKIKRRIQLKGSGIRNSNGRGNGKIPNNVQNANTGFRFKKIVASCYVSAIVSFVSSVI